LKAECRFCVRFAKPYPDPRPGAQPGLLACVPRPHAGRSLSIANSLARRSIFARRFGGRLASTWSRFLATGTLLLLLTGLGWFKRSQVTYQIGCLRSRSIFCKTASDLLRPYLRPPRTACLCGSNAKGTRQTCRCHSKRSSFMFGCFDPLSVSTTGRPSCGPNPATALRGRATHLGDRDPAPETPRQTLRGRGRSNASRARRIKNLTQRHALESVP
jgi:hypothetical protein